MSPREKAKELADFYHDYVKNEWVVYVATKCVDEILKTFEQPKDFGMNMDYKNIRYWIQVKQELNKL